MSHNFYWVREYTIFTNYIVDSFGQVGNQRHYVHSIGLKDKRSDRKIGFPSEIRTIGDLKKNLVRTSEWYKLLQPSQLSIYNKHEDIEFPDHMTLEEAYKKADYAFHVK